MHMWHHVTNHLIISNDKDSNSENRIKLCVCDIIVDVFDDASIPFEFTATDLDLLSDQWVCEIGFW
jgi:hypothetical protein